MACYICENSENVFLAHEDKEFCSQKCLTDYGLLRQLAARIQPYSKPELLEPVELTLEDVSEAKFLMPVCILAEHRISEALFLVNGQATPEIFGIKFSIFFQPDTMKFNSLKEANDVVNQLRQRYDEHWSFEVWSVNSLDY